MAYPVITRCARHVYEHQGFLLPPHRFAQPSLKAYLVQFDSYWHKQDRTLRRPPRLADAFGAFSAWLSSPLGSSPALLHSIIRNAGRHERGQCWKVEWRCHHLVDKAQVTRFWVASSIHGQESAYVGGDTLVEIMADVAERCGVLRNRIRVDSRRRYLSSRYARPFYFFITSYRYY
jgi:hypothetical protein